MPDPKQQKRAVLMDSLIQGLEARNHELNTQLKSNEEIKKQALVSKMKMETKNQEIS